jgi:hypothetical protein
MIKDPGWKIDHRDDPQLLWSSRKFLISFRRTLLKRQQEGIAVDPGHRMAHR